MDIINNNEDKGKQMSIQGNQRELIVALFDEIDRSLSVNYIIDVLKQEHDYKISGQILRDAIQEGVLYVDKITDDGVVYLALDDWGETIWKDLYED